MAETDGVPVVIGIDVGGTKLVAATLDADGRPLARRRRSTPAREATLLVDTLHELVAELDPDPDRPLPVGVGIAGTVDTAGVVRYGPNIGVRDLSLADRLGAPGRTVAVVNDASAAALAEQRVGAGRGYDELVLVTLGTGVGGGIVTGGRLLLGASGLAGEVGHLVVAEGGRRCPCGNRGCIEAYASGSALEHAARERLADPDVATALRDVPELTGPAVTEAAAAGDVVAGELLTDLGRWLGVALAGLVNLLDPQLLLVGGGAGPGTAPWVLPAAERSLERRVLGASHRSLPPLRLASLGDDAGLVGAGLLAADRAGILVAAPSGSAPSGSAPPGPAPSGPRPSVPEVP